MVNAKEKLEEIDKIKLIERLEKKKRWESLSKEEQVKELKDKLIIQKKQLEFLISKRRSQMTLLCLDLAELQNERCVYFHPFNDYSHKYWFNVDTQTLMSEYGTGNAKTIHKFEDVSSSTWNLCIKAIKKDIKKRRYQKENKEQITINEQIDNILSKIRNFQGDASYD